MQTFLPYPSLEQTAAVLDDRRLGKQRVEAKQILLALGVPVGEHEGNPQSRWRHHPAVRMWRGFERYLCHYGVTVCREWTARGFKDSLLDQFEGASEAALLMFRDLSPTSVFGVPPWLGNELFHASHRSNLLRKSPHYRQFGWSESDSLPYIWPS